MGKIRKLLKELAYETADAVVAGILRADSLQSENENNKESLQRANIRIGEMEKEKELLENRREYWKGVSTSPVKTVEDFEEAHRILQDRVVDGITLGPLLVRSSAPSTKSLTAIYTLKNLGWNIIQRERSKNHKAEITNDCPDCTTICGDCPCQCGGGD